jgi:hypothetical protein
MATNPGLFTEWPWARLGSFKVRYLAVLLANLSCRTFKLIDQ